MMLVPFAGGLIGVVLAQLLKSIYSAFQSVFKGLEGFSSAPPLIQNIGLAFLGILVPLAIAALTDIYQKKGRGDAFVELDLHVVLDYVFLIRRLIVYSVLIFLPLVFWEISGGASRLVELLISTVGFFLVSRIIVNVYKWTKGNAFKFRRSYLKKLKNPIDMEIVWRSVWAADTIERPYEIEFFRIFSSKIDELIKSHE